MKIKSGFLLRVIVTIVLILILFLSFQNKEVLNKLKKFEASFSLYLFIISIMLFFLSSFLGAFQWKLFLTYSKLKLPLKRVITYFFTGLFFNNMLVSNIGGDVVRAIDVSKNEKNGTRVFASIIIDRIFGLFCLILLGNISLLFTSRLSPTILWIYLLLDLAVIVVVFMVFLKRINIFFYKLFKKLSWKKLRKPLCQTVNIMGRYRDNKVVFLKALPIGLMNQFLKSFMVYVAALALGIKIDLVFFFIFNPILGTVLVLPLSINGVGLREYIGSSLFSTAGFNQFDVVSTLFLATLAIMISNLMSGVFFLFRENKKK